MTDVLTARPAPTPPHPSPTASRCARALTEGEISSDNHSWQEIPT